MAQKEETEFTAIPETIKCFSSSKPITKPFIRPTKPLPETNNSTLVESVVFTKREVNRCLGCRKKVGLTGFRCRCGELFCSEHRYSDRHDCSYDYKGVGREVIARENPVVKAAKIFRI